MMDEKKLPQIMEAVAYIRKVGRGRTLSKDLGTDEACDAFSQLLAGRFTAAQAGAFLQALRIKELSQEELDGLMEAFRLQTVALPPLPAGGIVLNLASDTARKGGYISLLAAHLLAARGMSVGVVHSDPMLSGNDASWDRSMGLTRPSATTAHVYDLIPILKSLRQIRAELGFRSCLHTAEKILNPWPDKPLILGISHRHYAERLAENLRQRGMTGKIVLGNHGTPDLVLHKETEIWEVLPGGEIRMIHIHPEDLSLHPDSAIYSLGFFPDWKGELAKEGFGSLGSALSYHMAFLRYASGEVSDIREGLLSSSELSGVA